VLWLADHPAIITGLLTDGDAVIIYTYLLGLERPLAVWNAWNLHLYMVVSLALVLAVPLRSLAERLRLVAITLGVVGFVALLICAVQVLSAAQAQAFSSLGVRLYTERETAFLERASQALIMVGMLLFPAALFFMSYLSFWTLPASGGAGALRSAPLRPDRGHRGTVERSPRRWIPLLTAALAVGAVVLLRSADPPGARDHLEGLRRLQELNPASARPHFGLGVHHEEAGRLEEAAEAYRAALDLDAGLAAAHFGLGNVLFKGGSFAAAEAAYRETLRLDPAQQSARQNLGISLFERGLYGEATGVFQEVLRLDPRHAAAHHDLGLALMRTDRACEALPHLQQSIALDRRFALDAAVRAEITRLKSVCPRP